MFSVLAQTKIVLLFLFQTMKEQCVKAIVMTPTKELCSQAYKNLQV